MASVGEVAKNVQENFGAIFAASFLGTMLLGVVIAQLYIYVMRYPNDALWMKLFIYFLVVCDVLSTIFTIWWLYYLFVTNWGNAGVFVDGNWLIATDPVILGIMGCANHFFFARRVKIITQNLWFTILICVFGLVTLAGALLSAVQFLQVKDFAKVSKLKAAGTIWLLSAALGDITITAVLSWYLRKKKSGFRKSDQIVEKVIRHTVTNGLLTATVALVDLILFLSSPKPLHIAVSLVLPRIYTNTMLSSLNSRNFPGDSSSTDQSLNVSSGMRRAYLLSRPTPAEVTIHVESHEMIDVVKCDTDWTGKSISQSQ